MKNNKINKIKNISICCLFMMCSNNLDTFAFFNSNFSSSFSSSFFKTAYAYDTATASNYNIKSNIHTRINNTILTGEYPIINNLLDQTFQVDVNYRITSQIDSVTSTYAQNQKSLELTYECILDNNYLSIVLYFKNTATNEIEIKSTCIDILQNKFIDINNILDINGYNYANKIVSAETTQQSIAYKKVDVNTAFYIKDNNIIILFGAGELTFAQRGNIQIEINTSNITNYTINDFYSKSNYNVKMVKLRDTLEYFGYVTQWVSSTAPINILKDDVIIASITTGSNRYAISNKFIKELEFAPELTNSLTYVPISFFSEILGMLINTDSNGNIVISNYNI